MPRLTARDIYEASKVLDKNEIRCPECGLRVMTFEFMFNGLTTYQCPNGHGWPKVPDA